MTLELRGTLGRPGATGGRLSVERAAWTAVAEWQKWLPGQRIHRYNGPPILACLSCQRDRSDYGRHSLWDCSGEGTKAQTQARRKTQARRRRRRKLKRWQFSTSMNMDKHGGEGGSRTKWVRPGPDRSSIFVPGHQPRCRDGIWAPRSPVVPPCSLERQAQSSGSPRRGSDGDSVCWFGLPVCPATKDRAGAR
jgi:hypothetical protein